MGVGAALMEELAVDKHRGLFVNHDLAGYEVPVHADVSASGGDPDGRDGSDVFADEGERHRRTRHLRSGRRPSRNAVYNATGVRVRDYPITLDKLLDRMPEIG